MKRRADIMRRLRARRGETIAEVLVALLISSLGMLLLANMIGSSGRLITKSKSFLDDYYQGENMLADRGGSGSAGSGNATFSTGQFEEKIRVNYFKNDKVGGRPVYVYEVSGP